MSNFFEDLKNDVEKGFDDLKEHIHEADEDFKKEETENYDTMEAVHNLYAWADGDVVGYPFEMENPSAKDQKMKSLVVMMVRDHELVSPVNGTISAIHENQNTIAITMDDNLAVAIKVCTGCMDLSKDAKILVQDGQQVAAGQPLVEFDKDVEAKSKLLLVAPADMMDFKAGGFKSVKPAGAVSKKDLLVSQ